MSSTAAREVTIASAQSARGASLRRWRAGPVPWMLPAIIVLGLFYLYPVFDVLRLSFTDATLIGNHENYTLSSIVSTLTSSRLPGVLLATLIFVGGSVVGQQILGLIIALVVNGVRNAIFWEQRCCGRQLRHRPDCRDRLVQALQCAHLIAIAQHDKRLGKL